MTSPGESDSVAAGSETGERKAQVPSCRTEGSPDSEKRVMVLSLCDQFGRMLESSRFVVDLQGVSHLQTGRYQLPCKIVDAEGEFTIELFARLHVLKFREPA